MAMNSTINNNENDNDNDNNTNDKNHKDLTPFDGKSK